MNRPLHRIFVYGFPSLYGGAGTELHHQIIVWLHLQIEVHLIPSTPIYRQLDLYAEMLKRGVVVHDFDEWEAIEAGDPVLGFCNAEFLENIELIHERSRRTVFANCMTWLFDAERQRMIEGKIGMFLYQNESVRQKNKPLLRELNDDPEIRYATFRPYFENSLFPYISERNAETFGCGRISRKDGDKFAIDTLAIYEKFSSPKQKRGIFLGWDYRSEEKLGEAPKWIRTAGDQNECSQQDFYNHCDIVLQPTETTENWPRVGFEAMASGSVLIVDRRGGWEQMVVHGETGWLCDSPADFIKYASLMAHNPNLRLEMAERAFKRGEELGGLEASAASWQKIFEEMAELPE
jgi:hypothetical protein